jgi:hypothetical protein
MKLARFLIVFLLFNFSSELNAQIEKLIVEKYYISDEIDSTDLTGGKLDSGSVTYRIYVDLKPGNVLKKIYGDINHEANFKSTENFYNHSLDGQTFANDFVKTRYTESTIALDSWLTLGQTAKKQGTKTYFGILKAQDTDGSFIGGVNNDGGSAMISAGLLTNFLPEMGFPLTSNDGMDTMNLNPISWVNYGIKDLLSGNDSTIFGSLIPKNEFISNSFSLGNSGVTDVVSDSNQIIIAQLTTKGDLRFEINLEVEQIIDGVPTIVKYVANDSILLPGEIYSPYLSYPFVCGCTNPDYLEYNSEFSCLAEGSCLTPIVYGCTDTMACNFDSTANFMIHNLCCYPGNCNDRDIAVVCPSLNESSLNIEIYPNPVDNVLFIDGVLGNMTELKYSIINSFGIVEIEKNLGYTNGVIYEEINVSELVKGIYVIQFITSNELVNKMFVKN